MNRSTLYFRAIDILCISFVGLIILEIMNVDGIAAFVTVALMAVWILTMLFFDFSKKDEFAKQCRANAYAFTGRAALIFGPFLLLIIIPLFGGFIDGLTDSNQAKEWLKSWSVDEIVLTFWMSGFAIYLARFQWVRFTGADV